MPHFTYTLRLKLESLYNTGMPVPAIACYFGVHKATIYRELKRGLYEHLNTDYTTAMRYSADIAQQKADFQKTGKGAPLKIGKDHTFVAFVEKMILSGYSPEAILLHIQKHGLHFGTKVCISTLYNYIDKGIFLHISNKNLLCKGKRRKHHKKKSQKQPCRGLSIEQRPKEVSNRGSFGHWEIDSVIGKRAKGETLVTMTERLTR